MPVYTVTTQMGRLDQEQKEGLAVGITTIHGEETGAPEPLIHVVFLAYPKASAWSSSKPGAPVIVNAVVRRGRSKGVRARILRRISDLVCDVMEIPACDVFVGLFDLPPHSIMEAGMIAPPTRPEAEAAWDAEFYKRFPADRYA